MRLPARQRQVVALRLLLDLDTRHTADALGITPNTVMAHMAHALAALRHDLIPERQAGEPIMNDEELAAAVKESVRGAHMNIPAEQIVHHSRAIRARRRIPALAGALTAAAAATAAAALVLTSGPGAVPGQQATAGHIRTVVTAAWTVREDADGTVTVYLRQYANPAGLQQTLQADGINAIVRPLPPRRIRPACSTLRTGRRQPCKTLS